jgi:hypothetical protein
MTVPVEAPENPELFPPIDRLTSDIVKALKKGSSGGGGGLVLTRGDVRYMVDVYYQIQEFRKASCNQRESTEVEPNQLVSWLSTQFYTLERQVHRALDAWTETDPASVWAKSITGIGPVISAGLAAHLDIGKAPTVGHIWNFCGLNPKIVWEKGQKRPFNLRMKVLCWKIGDSFVKFHNHPKCSYGKLYAKRKALELQRNEEGLFAAQAAETLEKKRITEYATRSCYEAGKLPPGRLDLRARRWAVKLFLSHWHDAAHWAAYNRAPPRPFALEHLPGHYDYIPRESMT